VALDVVPGVERIHQLRGRCRSIQESIWRAVSRKARRSQKQKIGTCQKIVGDAVCAYSTVPFSQIELHAKARASVRRSHAPTLKLPPA
jgi:hypothetical protein